MEQTTTTDRAWANGDLVRLTCEDPNGPGRHRGQPGEWGMVHSVGEDGSVKVRLAGFSRIPGSVGPIATVPGDTLVAWERRPEDEPSIRSNVVATLQSLAWIGVDKAARNPYGRFEVTGWCYGWPDARAFTINDPILPDVLPYVGDGLGTAAAPEATAWTLNEAGNALLDQIKVNRTMALPGGGECFDLEYDRRGKVLVHDLGTHAVHMFEGGDALRLLHSGHQQTRAASDGRMPDIIRKALPYPRSLRLDQVNGIAVVEADEDVVEIRKNGEVVAAMDGADAVEIRSAVLSTSNLSLWTWRLAADIEQKRSSAPAPVA